MSAIVLHTIVLGEDGKRLVEDWATRGLDASSALEPSVPLTVAIFLLGIVGVWLYAAMRPRFGPSPKTALYAGTALWIVSHFYTGIYVSEGVVILPDRMVWLPVVWGFFEVQAAILLGAWLYRE